MSQSADGANRSPLLKSHLNAGAQVVRCDGWEVPLHYGDPENECLRLHQRAGVIDLTPVGRIRVRGDGGLGLLDRLCSADVARQEDNTAMRSLLLNESGGVIDLVTVLRLDDWWVVNCSPPRRQAVLEHLQAHAEDGEAKVDDQTFKTCTLAVIGPMGAEILDRFLPEKVSSLQAGDVRTGSMLIARYIAARTGPTDLWSLEVTLPNMLAGQAWKYVTAKAGDNALTPAGINAAEVLRIEACLPRWSNEFDENIDPISAGLSRHICFDKDFLGARAVAAMRETGGPTRRIAWAIEQAGGAAPSAEIAPGDRLLAPGGEEIGKVTSAARSPVTRTWLGQARATVLLGEGSTFSIETRKGQQVLATVAEVF